MARSGRRTQLKAETQEAADLARFLREVTQPLTVAQLAEQFGRIAKSTLWAEWRSGAKDIPHQALQDVIRARMPVGHHKELLERARVLCGRAVAARAGRGTVVSAQRHSAQTAWLPQPKPRPCRLSRRWLLPSGSS